MSAPLFNNVGRDLKIFAKVIHTICMVGSIIIGLILFIASCALFGSGDDFLLILGLAGFVVAIMICVGGYFVSKLLVMGLYAYGELVEKVTSIENKVVGRTPQPDPTPDPTPKPKPNPKPNPTPPKGGWVCPFCEHGNPAGTSECQKCGAEYNCWEE